MFKQLFTLARGRSEDAGRAFLDANALSLLRQQMREAADGVERSRKAVAVVMAYHDREKANLGGLETQIADLETRALEALEKEREDLAGEAAEAIADLEEEAKATRKAIATYGAEIARLRQCLKEAQAQLARLKRGQRLAEANDKSIKLRAHMPGVSTSELSDAAETLTRLQERQEHALATAEAMSKLSAKANAETLDDRMADAGIGAPKHATGAAVLERLKAKKADTTKTQTTKTDD